MDVNNKPLFGLRELIIELTAHCNEPCTMCNRWRWPKQCIGLATLVKRLDEANQLGVRRCRFSGGEPLLHPEIEDIIDRFKEYKTSALFHTNGLLLSAYLAEKLASVNVAVSISIDGLTAATHDQVRGLEGAYERTKLGLTAYATAKQKQNRTAHLTANFTVHDLNIKDLQEDFSVIDALGVDQMRFAIAHRPGGMSFNEEKYAILQDFLTRAVTNPPRTRLLIHPQMFAIAERRITNQYLSKGLPSYEIFQTNSIPCYLAHFAMLIAPDGYVYPCFHSHWDNDGPKQDRVWKMGNITEKTLAEIWGGEEYRSFREKMNPVKIGDVRDVCGCCEYVFKFLKIKESIQQQRTPDHLLSLST